MARNLQQYFNITRTIPSNKRATIKQPVTPNAPDQQPLAPIKTEGPPPPKTVFKKLGDFLSTSVLKWAVDGIYHRRYNYPKTITQGTIAIESAKGPGQPIVIGLAADWANDTDQAKFVADKMMEKGPDKILDYTIHLGDTYYSGSTAEIDASFGTGNGNTGLWPRGAKGTFLLAGNHEMYCGGQPYYNLITTPPRDVGVNNQGHEPVFCLETEHWCILGLDTAYNCITHKLLFTSTNKRLDFPDAVIQWLKDKIASVVKCKGVIVLSHHQYISAFGDESEFREPAKQLKQCLGDIPVIWIWGHEHRFSIYGKYADADGITTYGRCIGNGGMPDEHADSRAVITNPSTSRNATNRNLILYDFRIADNFDVPKLLFPKLFGTKKLNVGYNGYAILTLDNANAKIEYYAAYRGTPGNVLPPGGQDTLLFTENWEVADCKLTFVNATDNSVGTGGSALTYPTGKGPDQVGSNE